MARKTNASMGDGCFGGGGTAEGDRDSGRIMIPDFGMNRDVALCALRLRQ